MRELEERWYRVADVARRVGVSEQAVRAAIAAGHLQVVRPAGLRRGRFPVIRIPASALTAWLNAAPTSAGHE
jgi:excisionase family DNA binding protein